jgi:hypothetical protein
MFSRDVDFVLVAAGPSMAHARDLRWLASAAVPGYGGHRKYGTFGVSGFLRPANLSLLCERTKPFSHLCLVGPEGRCGCDVGDRVVGLPGPRSRPYCPAAAARCRPKGKTIFLI